MRHLGQATVLAGFLLSLNTICHANDAGLQHPPSARATEIGVSIYNRLSFDVDDKDGMATLTGNGAGKTPLSAIPHGTLIEVVFTKPGDPLLYGCRNALAGALPDGYELQIWGYPPVPAAPSADGKESVILTIGDLTECGLVPAGSGLGEAPPYMEGVGNTPSWAEQMPASPASSNFPVDASATTVGVDIPYGGGELSISDMRFLSKAMAGPADAEATGAAQQAVTTVLPDMAKKLHRIITDERASEAARAASVQQIFSAGLTPSDYDSLAGMKHKELLLRQLPQIDAAKLHFLLNDPIIAERDRKRKIDAFLTSAKDREKQQLKLQREQEREKWSLPCGRHTPFACPH